MINGEHHLACAEFILVLPLINKFKHMKRARQILTHKKMTNGEQHVSPIKIRI